MKGEGAERATSRHSTQLDAKNVARVLVKNSDGGELIVHGRDGKIITKDTVGRDDPFPPRG